MNLVLIGYRGTGKSTVAQILAQRLGREAVSLDQAIERAAGRSIPQIVAALGWEYFRDMEQQVTREWSARDKLVMDTGGGVVLRPVNVEGLRENGRLFWLRAEQGTIAARIGQSTQRPALVAGMTFIEEIAQVLAERSPLYAAAADHAVDTDERTPEEIADCILAFW